ncbi:MAG: efflux RND transporter periplasmic adaptor subunit [Arenicellaceae bacterium]|nr:efflux RND transporter periplasmic adaptor subunit [Arenicellaceae bacterium]
MDQINTENNNSQTTVSGKLTGLTRGLRRKRTLLVFGLIVCATFGWWFTQKNTAAIAKPLVVTVDQGDLENAVTAAGNLQPSDYVDVGAQVSGQLETFLVEIGDQVTSGQLLAEIDATVQLNRVEASRASLRALEAQLSARAASLKLAQANADRQTRLIEEDATSQADFDSSINTLASAQSSLIQLQSQIAQSNASLASDEATLAFSKIAAPIAGTVISIDKKVGQTLNASQQAPTILRIADLSTMTVQGEVSEADVSKLSTNMDVYFTTLGGGSRRWYGNLRQILPKPVVTNNVVLYTALFDVDNSDATLLSDMTAQIFFITSAATNVVRVPVGALDFKDVNNLLGLAQSNNEATNTEPNATTTPQIKNPYHEPNIDRSQTRPAGMPADFTDLSPEEIARFRERAAANGGRGDGSGSGGGRNRGEERTGGAQRNTNRIGTGTTKSTVLIVKPNGEIENRKITIGVTTRIAAEVLSGLEVGDQVVAGIIQARDEAAQGGASARVGELGGGGGGRRF